MSRIHALAAALITMVGASCTTSPYSGQTISTGTITFGGFGDAPNATIRFEAFVRSSNNYQQVGVATTKATPTFAAGAICPNSPALYMFNGSAPLNWPIYWDLVNGQYQAKVKATEYTAGITKLYFTDNPNGVDCIIAHGFNSTCDFVDVAYTQCGYKLTEAVVKTTSTAPWFEL